MRYPLVSLVVWLLLGTSCRQESRPSEPTPQSEPALRAIEWAPTEEHLVLPEMQDTPHAFVDEYWYGLACSDVGCESPWGIVDTISAPVVLRAIPLDVRRGEQLLWADADYVTTVTESGLVRVVPFASGPEAVNEFAAPDLFIEAAAGDRERVVVLDSTGTGGVLSLRNGDWRSLRTSLGSLYREWRLHRAWLEGQTVLLGFSAWSNAWRLGAGVLVAGDISGERSPWLIRGALGLCGDVLFSGHAHVLAAGEQGVELVIASIAEGRVRRIPLPLDSAACVAREGTVVAVSGVLEGAAVVLVSDLTERPPAWKTVLSEPRPARLTVSLRGNILAVGDPTRAVVGAAEERVTEAGALYVVDLASGKRFAPVGARQDLEHFGRGMRVVEGRVLVESRGSSWFLGDSGTPSSTWVIELDELVEAERSR